MNAQNIPEEARKVFVPAPGHAFVSGDFSNLELRVMAYEFDDDVLQKQFTEGKSIHDENTKVMFGITKDSPQWKDCRYASKKHVFKRSYGGGIRSSYESVCAEVPDFSITYAQFTSADRKYFDAHPKLKEGFEKASTTALQTRVCTTATGRKRFFLGMPEDVKREGINTPIQGAAGDIENESLINLHAECLKHEDWKLVATVHDSNVIECPIADVPLCAKVMKAIMEKPRHLWGKEIVFPVDISVSTKSWGEMESYADWDKAQGKGKSKQRRKRNTRHPKA